MKKSNDVGEGETQPSLPTQKLPEMTKATALASDQGMPIEDVPNVKLGDDQEFFIPIHDFIRFTEDEVSIIDHPAFQRLGKVYQLGQAHLVYRSATHKRMEHVLGSVWVAQKIANAVKASYQRAKKKGILDGQSPFGKYLSEPEERFVRLAALLHDIGHLPAGHTLEDELGLLEPHDADKRLEIVLSKEEWIPGVKSTRLRDLIDRLYRKYLHSPTSTVTPVAILKKLVSKDAKGTDGVIADIRVSVCRDIVGNTICADLLDYLYRDWYHIGKPKFFDRRLFEYMQIRCDHRDNTPKFVISYGERNRPKRDSISSILDLLEARYNLGESVLFHPTKCAAAAMLERGISELYAVVSDKDKWLVDLEKKALSFSDEELISAFLKECEELQCVPGLISFQALAARDIYKSVCVNYKDDFNAAEFEMIEHCYLARDSEERKVTIEEKRRAAQTRREALLKLEQDFDLQAGTLVMYCPSRSMNSKIAKVKIIYNGSIKTLDDWDKDKRVKLAGGHCAAQLERFESMWRLEVFMRESAIIAMFEKHGKDYFHLFQRAVKNCLMGVASDEMTLEEHCLTIVMALTDFKESPFYRKIAIEPIAARNMHKDCKYPIGAPLLKRLVSG